MSIENLEIQKLKIEIKKLEAETKKIEKSAWCDIGNISSFVSAFSSLITLSLVVFGAIKLVDIKLERNTNKEILMEYEIAKFQGQKDLIDSLILKMNLYKENSENLVQVLVSENVNLKQARKLLRKTSKEKENIDSLIKRIEKSLN